MIDDAPTRRSPAPDPRLRRLLKALPGPIRVGYGWLIRPEAWWARWPLGLLLIVGGCLGFLPILGFWMVPIGALLLGEDIKPLHRATLAGLGALQGWWIRRRFRRRHA